MEISLTGTILLTKIREIDKKNDLNLSQFNEEIRIGNYHDLHINEDVLGKSDYYSEGVNEINKKITDNFTMPEDYIDIKFTTKEYLFTKIDINSNMVNIYPHKKPKIKIIKNTYTRNYFVYNMLMNNFQAFAKSQISENDENFSKDVIKENFKNKEQKFDLLKKNKFNFEEKFEESLKIIIIIMRIF